MAFCPECGKSAAAEATRCVHCGYEFEAKSTAKPGGRFKGTMMMTAPAVAKPAAKAPVAATAPENDVATAATPPAPAATAAAQPAPKAAVKGTMIGTGVSPAAIAAAAAKAAAPVASAAAAAPAADASKKNMAFAQTQLGAGIAPAAPAARVAPAAPAPAPAPVVATAPTPVPPVYDEDPAAEDSEPSRQPKYLPGDPMAPQPVAARAPMLRYDDSIASLPRHNPLGDKKWVWIAAGVIVFACLALVIILASKMSQ